MTNFTVQTFIGLPAFSLVILILVLAFRKSKLKVNNFLICGSLLETAHFITNELFWIGDPGAKSLANFLIIKSILFSPVFVLFLYGILQTIIENNLLTVTRRQGVWIVFVLSVITLGFYVPFWYLKNHVIHKKGNLLVVIFASFLTLSFFLHTYLYADSSAFSVAVWSTIDLLTIVFGAALAMNFRTIILKENPEIEISPVFTFLLGILYLQYHVNQLDNDKVW